MAREQRKLAAIVAADVVGYSRLMGQDESGTLARLQTHRTRRLEPVVGRNGGRIVKLTGDGVLIEFASAVDAVRATIEFQQAMDEANRDLPEAQKFVFRIGVHLGDLIVEGDDLYGDGINIAARLEAEAAPGGILISRAVRDAIQGRLEATLHATGELTLKNIARPVRAFRVEWDAAHWQPAAIAAAVAPRPAAPPALPDKPSLAVLPFQNLSADPEQEYFADGIVEDIITALSHFKDLFVIARNSSFTYKGKSIDIRQIGRELGVRYVLEGSVRHSGNKGGGSRVRISCQLVEATSGAHIWADRFDGELADIFDLQDEIAVKVVGAIMPTVEQAEIERARRKPTENLDAYDLYLRGLPLYRGRAQEPIEQALALQLRASELDPGFVPPYGIAARCYSIGHVADWAPGLEQRMAEVRRLTSRVITIGHDDAAALSGVGSSIAHVCRELDLGAALIDKALSINPNLANGWMSRALVSMYRGEHAAVLVQNEKARRLSPIDADIARAEMANAYACAFLSRYDEALGWVATCLAHQPNYYPAILAGVVANAHAGNIEEAQRLGLLCKRIFPGASLANFDRLTPIHRAEDKTKFRDALRIAGIPD